MEVKLRRYRENKLFEALKGMLPLSSLARSHLDKSGQLRNATAYLQLRTILADPLTLLRPLASIPENSKLLPPISAFHPIARKLSAVPASNLQPSLQSLTKLMHQFMNIFEVLDGFVCILDKNGKIVYISESACAHIGPGQVGYECTDDAEMLKQLLALGIDSYSVSILDPEIHITLRFDGALANKRRAGIYIDGFKPMHFVGRVAGNNNCRFIGYGYSMTDYRICEISISSNTFIFRSTPALEIIFVDGKILELTGYQTSSFVNQSLYKFVHVDDVACVVDSHTTVVKQSQSMSGYYRLLTHGGGWVWARTDLTSLVPFVRLKTNTPQIILGITTVFDFSATRECGDVIVDSIQCSEQTVNYGTEVWGMLGEHSQSYYQQLNSASKKHRERSISSSGSDEQITVDE